MAIKKVQGKITHPRFQQTDAEIISVSMAEKRQSKSNRKRTVTFDTDSRPVGMDTQASKSICIDPSMMDNLRPANIRVLGIANTKTVCKWQGDWRLPITDDNGITSTEIIPDTPLVPSAAKSILSPQHFAKQYPVGSHARQLCRATQFHDRCIFRWGDKNERVLTIRNDSSDVPTFYSAADITAFAMFTRPESKNDEELFALEATVFDENSSETHNILPIVSDDEDSISSTSTPTRVETHQPNFQTPSNLIDSKSSPTRSAEPLATSKTEQNSTDKSISEENLSDFSEFMPSPMAMLPNDLDIEAKVLSDTAGFLRWHYKLNHLSFRKMKALATLGIIPRKYGHCKPPICKACQYGKQHRRPWRTKGKQTRIKPVNVPGQCISVDQMESSLEGFVAQLKGKLTTRRYVGATVFRDHATDFIHVSLMTDFTGQATVDACKEFEACSRTMGVKVKHYHCDNGRFADNQFWLTARNVRLQSLIVV